MLKIGYVRLSDTNSSEDTSALKAMGCQVVRAEEASDLGERPVLDTILDFIGSGDQLVVGRLEALGGSSRLVLDVMDRLEARGANLCVTEQRLSTKDGDGRALRAALEAVARLEPASPTPRRAVARTQEIQTLQRAGVGPVEIARRLGVSRMTVWRKLKALETQA